MKTFLIAENDANQRLDKFLTKAVPNLPQALLYKYIRTKRIKVNGGRADIALRLQAGDSVALYIADDFFAPRADGLDFLSAPRTLSVLYEDENLLVLNKPAGLLSHADDLEFTDTLIARTLRYLCEKGDYDPAREQSFTPALVNRIDRNTAGIVLAAKNAEALRILNQKMREREIKKYYLCIVHGRFTKQEATLRSWLEKDGASNTGRVFSKEGAGRKEIQTRYRVLGERGGLSLLEVALLTGRTHQIRAHLASVGHPLLGDGKYGSNERNKKLGYKRQLLCSYRTVFEFQTDAGMLQYLNQRSFEVPDVWFVEAFYGGEL